MNKNYAAITDKCFINAPFDRLQNDLLPFFVENKLQPEIGLEGQCLWECSKNDFETIAKIFQQQGLACTLHAPFHDLAPGGFEDKIVAMSREKLKRAFALVSVFHPKSIVCHLGYEAKKHDSGFDRWLATSLTTWKPLIQLAESEGTVVMFENTYESDPVAHKRLFTELHAENVGFCLDTGHLLAFAGTGYQPWLAELSPWLGQLHLHDNDGTTDAHKALGKGIFNFFHLFKALKKRQPAPLLTLEPHSEEDLQLSLEYLYATGLLELLSA